jgi:hypothetical protein
MTSLLGDNLMNMKKLCSAFILTLALATSALAGEMEAGITTPPPKAPASATARGGDIGTPSTSSATTGDEASAADVSVTEAALGLVGTVLALF